MVWEPVVLLKLAPLALFIFSNLCPYLKGAAKNLWNQFALKKPTRFNFKRFQIPLIGRLTIFSLTNKLLETLKGAASEVAIPNENLQRNLMQPSLESKL